jgi:tRNA U34 5-methylaminomethyl-2-thiouridine-forming methyltransferase MnmC
VTPQFQPTASPDPAYRLVTVAGGAQSIHAVDQGETFHPVIGPAAEAEALYVRQLQLRERIAAQTEPFVVWDVGLGAAANPLTLLRHARGLHTPLRMVSFDRTLAPLRFALHHARELGYLLEFEPVIQRLLLQADASPGSTSIQFTNQTQPVTWDLHVADFPALLASWAEGAPCRPPAPHAIMFDAFSPARNPDMWTLPLFSRLHRMLAPDRPCALPTYSRSTLLRVTLLLAGFFVGAGHATGEKEETTLAANTPALIGKPLDRAWLSRARRSTSAEPLREPLYRQRPLSTETWDQLLAHPQFR